MNSPPLHGTEMWALSWPAALRAVRMPALIVAACALGLQFGYLLFHVLAEGFSIVIAFSALTVAATSPKFAKDRFLIYIAIGIGWCAVLDLVHMMTFKGMGLLPVNGANTATQLWIAARYLQATVMLSALLFLRLSLSVHTGFLHAGFGLLVSAVLVSIATNSFPAAYIEGQGLTPFKIYSEYVIILMLSATLVLMWHSRALLAQPVLAAICASLAAMIVAEFAFTRYVSVYATANLIGHLFKIIAYWFIYVAMVKWTLGEPFRKLAEAERSLRESEERYVRAVDGANDGIWEWFPATGEDYLSPRWKQLLGYEDHELANLEESFFNQIHPEDMASAQEALRAHFEERRPYRVELRLRCKDGAYRWFFSRGQAEWDEQGRPLRMSGSITDITDQKLAENMLATTLIQLRERNKELKCLYAVSSLANNPQKSIAEVVEQSVQLIPPGWLHPEITCARITLDGVAYTTPTFRETPWNLSTDIEIAGRKVGAVEVFYLDEKPEIDDGPFLKEERSLIDDLAKSLGATVERRRALADLLQSEFRWQFAVEGAGDGLWDWDVPTSTVFFSTRWKEMLGYTEDEIGNSLDEWSTRIHTDDKAQTMAAVQAHLDGATPYYSNEHRVCCKDGSWKWIFDRGLAVQRDAAGKALRVIGTHSDITERKQAADRLLASEKRSQTIVQTAQDGFWMTDLQGRLLEVNAAYCRMSGYTEQELLGKTIAELEAKEGASEAEAHMQTIMARGSDRFETRHRRKDGSVFDVEANVQYQDAAGGRMVCFVTDITARKQVELKLRESELKFRALFETADEAILLFAGEQWVDCNAAAARVFGCTREQIIGAHPARFSPLTQPDGQSSAELSVKRIGLAYANKPQAFEWVHCRSDGTLFDAEVHLNRVDLGGEPLIQAIVRDVTEHKRIEQREHELASRIERALFGTIGTVSKMMDLRDPYTSGHERRVGAVSVAIAAEMGLDEAVQRGMRVAGSLHDVGKITVPAEILSKPGKLSVLEYEMIKEHARQGYEILKDIDFPWPVAEVARQHHECIDGSGYPRGLKGDEIVLEARILAVADVVEAMSSHRPYRAGAGIEKALAEVEQGRGTSYDAHVVDACLRLFRDKGYSIPD